MIHIRFNTPTGEWLRSLPGHSLGYTQMQAAIAAVAKDCRNARRQLETTGAAYLSLLIPGCIVMCIAYFYTLPEYSISLPTGTTIGKRWKRRLPYLDKPVGWEMGEFIEHPDPELVGIRWSEILLV